MVKDKCLVIGGAGFVGSNLVRRLTKNGSNVLVVDDLSNGNLKNLTGLTYQFLNADISDPYVFNYLESDKFDRIFHLACTALLPSFDRPHRDLRVNGMGMLNVIEIARRNKAKIVYTSSGSVYGEVDILSNGPIKEIFDLNPSSPYGASKLVAEHHLRIFAKYYEIPSVALRLFNVYGPRQKISPEIGWIPVVPKFMHDCVHNKQSVIFGSGEQTRDFNYVDDVVDAIIMASDYWPPDDYFNVFNVCSGRETDIITLHDKIRFLFGQDIEPKFAEEQPGELWRVVASNEKIKKYLGWKPKTDLERGLQYSKDYYEGIFK